MVHGPSFLSDYKSNWPVKLEAPVHLSHDDPDVISGQLACLADVQNTAQQTSDEQTVHPFQRLYNHYSSYYKLKKAICWLLSVCNRLRGNGLTVGPVTVPEMYHVENVLLRYVQNCVYHDEMVSLRTRGHVTKSSAVNKLCPSIKDGLMVAGGRLKHAAIPETCKYPVILPHGHPVSHLIVRDHHGYAHLGTEWPVEGKVLDHKGEKFDQECQTKLRHMQNALCIYHDTENGKSPTRKMSTLAHPVCIHRCRCVWSFLCQTWEAWG